MKKKLVGEIVWVVIAVVLWTIGLIIFVNSQEKLLYYLCWGALCSISTIKTVMAAAANEGRKGRRRGANEYTVTDHGSHYTVENHPLRGAILGFIGGLLGGVLIGPIVVPVVVIIHLVGIVRIVKEMKGA